MDATVEEIVVGGGESATATRRSSRAGKPTAKLQENLEATASRTRTSNKVVAEQMVIGNAANSNESLTQMMLRTVLQETSTHLMSEQKKMLQTLWDALMENQRTATKVMSDQLEMIHELRQEMQTSKAQAAEDRKKAEELRRMHEQTAEELRQMREQLIEQLGQEMLLATMEMLHTQVTTFRNASGRRTDVILAGDFNRHDHLWGGDEVIGRRQGEAGPIVGLMEEHSLLSLLPRGTKTWENSEHSSTIDLILASAELAEEMVACGIHPTEHGSDHRAIRTEFDLGVPERRTSERRLFKNAPWTAIRERVEERLRWLPWDGSVQTQTDDLMGVVLEAIDKLVPLAKPSPYAKRWWTTLPVILLDWTGLDFEVRSSPVQCTGLGAPGAPMQIQFSK
ncbi:hypothetical protein AUP68_10531 [Ilyonectria robusta]